MGYGVIALACLPFLEQVVTEARRTNLDPALAVSVMVVESGCNSTAIGPVGEVGLFQLRPEYHKGNLKNPKVNIGVGVRYLAKLKYQFNDKYKYWTWVEKYNRGPGRPVGSLAYYRKVIKVYGKIRRPLESYQKQLQSRQGDRRIVGAK